jgi:predicted amidophosphoribosyltransferase
MDCSIKKRRLRSCLKTGLQSFKRVLQLSLDLFYPPLCLHCQVLLSKRKGLFCQTCLEQISLIDSTERCRTCFAEIYKGKCEKCMTRTVVIHRQIAACEAFGPAKAILNGIHLGKNECIPAAASLMAYQWLELKMPLPDLLIPLPTSFWEKQRLGFDVQLKLAMELGKIFSVPIHPILQRKFDRERFLTQGEFYYRIQILERKTGILCDRRVLIIAPLLDDDQFRCIGKELKTYFPAQIDALAFATLE